MIIRLVLLVLSYSLIALPSLSYAADTKTDLAKQRITFQQAQKALKTNQTTQFKKLYSKLNDYPLQPYLSYLHLRHRLSHVDDATITQFLTKNPDAFYSDRLRNSWLNRLAKEKKWPSYLTHYQLPQSLSRQCLRLQALIATGKGDDALADTQALWLVPISQHKNCDPAFKYWQSKKKLTDELREKRIFLALKASQFSLATYLAKSLSSDDVSSTTKMISQWKQAHHSPALFLKGSKTLDDTAVNRDILQHAIKRLSRKSAQSAFTAWQPLQTQFQFTAETNTLIRSYIGKRAALNHNNKALSFFADDSAEPWRVRAALWKQDWPEVQKSILNLSTDEQHESRWQYWLGRSQAEQGKQAAADSTFQGLIMDRDYYSFLSADKLGQQYQMNHNPIVVAESALKEFSQRPAMLRLYEFHTLNMKLEARRQAYKLMQTLSPRELQLLATLTHKWGWHNQTIALLGKAKYWDALDLRFPVLFDTEMAAASKLHNIDTSWLLGVARQESAFNPRARSHVGARGLMQLMPATATLVARLINKPINNMSELYDPARNIQLGSTYLNKMYHEKQSNPVLATASYNAGPHRIARWLPKKDLAADIWVENIPYTETRRYTRRVLSYSAIFDYQRKQTITPLSDRMPAVRAKTP
ncbi:MAG: transglycosylase [Gammaproteobacteria bacterium]|nr:MAG: transglycosylase [Gammaproteobacteria bacterium]